MRKIAVYVCGAIAGVALVAVAYLLRPSMEFKTAREVNQEIVREACSRPEGSIVRVLKDAAGNIGAYAVAARVMDSPVSYLDIEGNEIALFHIFGSDEEKNQAGKIIDELSRQFPVEEIRDCSEFNPEAGER